MRAWELCCYYATKHWPFSFNNRLAWPVYLWMLPWAGSEAFRRGDL